MAAARPSGDLRPGLSPGHPSGRPLSLRQRLFLWEYLRNGGNGTRAALVAYRSSSPNVAHVQAWRALRSATVKRELARALEAQDLSLERLAEIHARLLGLADTGDTRDMATALAALKLAYLVRGLLDGRNTTAAPSVSAEDVARLIDALRETRAD